jgi:two-component system, OmpR family, response regulator ChvI
MRATEQSENGMSNNSDGSSSSRNNNNNNSTTQTVYGKSSPSYYTILIVDDEPDITLLYKLALEGAGFKVEVFNDPIAALTKVKDVYSSYSPSSHNMSSNTSKKPYDLLLLDIRMPKMNGFELYREIKKIVENRKEGEIRTCFITAHEVYYEKLKKEFPKIDVGCFIKKPINATDLIKSIKHELLLE